MKLETLKLGWNKLSPRGRTATAAGIIAISLAVALASGIGASTAANDSAPSLGNPRIALEETDRAYHVTISVPENEQARLNVRMNGRNLLVGSTDSAYGVALEQQLRFPNADAMQAPTFDRQGDQLVVTVPKRSAGPAPTNSIGRSPFSAVPDVDASTDPMLGSFRQMQQQMDRMMARAMSGFGNLDPFASMPDLGGMSARSGLDLEDKGSEYVIRASVPEDALNNVNVSVDNERVLKITASGNSSGANRYQMSNVTQIFTLPGPVQSDKIQVDKSQGALVITLPKA